jgi:SAM-dependent MidA family methyltransferase
MNRDPNEQRDTPLVRKLKERIRRGGPISVADYFEACLHDPEHGYYRNRPAIGARGDFTTAPEISQIFGELIGLWCATVWQQMGAPPRVNLIELGPGRGTLMRDALRAARLLPPFLEAVRLHFVESNDALIEAQVAGMPSDAKWHRDLARAEGDIEPGPTLLVANEFLDALPVAQLVASGGRWLTRTVGLDDAGRLRFETGKAAPNTPHRRAADDSTIVEIGLGPAAVAEALARFAARAPLAALIIDYGYASASSGDTLQAVADQAYVSPFHAPGETDLTAHVDFTQFADTCRAVASGCLAVDGPVTQAEFLGRLGAMERASRLMAANPAKALEIEAGVARLMAPNGMGTRHKAIGVRSLDLPPLPGFAVGGAGAGLRTS